MELRVLYGVMGIALAVLLIGGGTYAYFSDTETSTGNVFSAGTLNLRVGSADPMTETIDFDGLKPGDTSADTGVVPVTWAIDNIGTVNGTLNITCGTITNDENGLTEPEEEAGDTGAPGELGANLLVAFWIETTPESYYLRSDGTNETCTGLPLPSDAYDILNNYGETSWANLTTLAGGASAGTFHVEYNLTPETGNDVQSDNCTFDLTFRLDQVHT